jgi:hypothetical protein
MSRLILGRAVGGCLLAQRAGSQNPSSVLRSAETQGAYMHFDDGRKPVGEGQVQVPRRRGGHGGGCGKWLCRDQGRLERTARRFKSIVTQHCSRPRRRFIQHGTMGGRGVSQSKAMAGE